MLRCWATDVANPASEPRWGVIGKQKITDEGALPPERMKTVDDEILDNAFKFMDKSKAANKPFFVWLNPSRMHVFTHLSDKYKNMENAENGWYTEEAGMTPLADQKGMALEGGMRVPANHIENGIISGLDWFPTLLGIAGDSNIKDELLKGKNLNGTNYKVHLDGYDQLNLITGNDRS